MHGALDGVIDAAMAGTDVFDMTHFQGLGDSLSVRGVAELKASATSIVEDIAANDLTGFIDDSGDTRVGTGRDEKGALFFARGSPGIYLISAL